jgi:hypothetical protein
MLPLTIEMRDHLRQEKDRQSPFAFARSQAAARFLDLGLWSSNHFVIYYSEGRVPQPGITCSASNPEHFDI